jgi:iron complex transport system substrate-binding protein
MAGRKVTVPTRINRIATLGAVPVINGFLFAFGEGGKIVNGLPEFARSPRYRFQTLFAPSIASKPMMQGAGREPRLEELLKASPDVAFTMDRDTAEIVQRTGIPAVFLAWRQPEDVRHVMRLIGDVLDKPAIANDYIRYFDETTKRVRAAVEKTPRARRPHVLYCNLKRLTQDQLIGEWWIETAGGISVTNNGRDVESYSFSMEQLFAWNPDVLILANTDDRKQLREDSRFAALNAVVSHRAFVAPIGAHLWSNRTVEQPLTLLWAARIFSPDGFKDLDMVKEMQSFYGRFFRYQMTEAEAHSILNGNP